MLVLGKIRDRRDRLCRFSSGNMVMMMHPDDFEKLLFIAKVFLIIGILIYSFKCGNAAYHILRWS